MKLQFSTQSAETPLEGESPAEPGRSGPTPVTGRRTRRGGAVVEQVLRRKSSCSLVTQLERKNAENEVFSCPCLPFACSTASFGFRPFHLILTHSTAPTNHAHCLSS